MREGDLRGRRGGGQAPRLDYPRIYRYLAKSYWRYPARQEISLEEAYYLLQGELHMAGGDPRAIERRLTIEEGFRGSTERVQLHRAIGKVLRADLSGGTQLTFDIPEPEQPDPIELEERDRVAGSLIEILCSAPEDDLRLVVVRMRHLELDVCGRPPTFAQIGERLGITPQRAHRLYVSGIAFIVEECRRKGITLD